MLMNKFLRYSFVMLLAFICGSINAGTITFADLNLENGVQYSEPFDGDDFTVTFGGGGNNGKYYNTGAGIRIYGDGTMTIAAKSGNISKIVITYDGANKPDAASVVDGGTYDVETGTWTGSANTIVFTRPAGSGHWRVKKIEVTVGGAAPTVVAPKFSVPGGTYYEPQTVALTCETEGAKILYTIPAGDDPVYTNDEDVNGIWYDGNPLQITRTTTIKAMAVKDGKTSSIVSATYTIEELQTLSLAQAQAADKGAAVIVEGVVVASAANGAVLSDGTDYLYYYNTANPLTIGQIVRMSGQLGEYGGAKQLTSTATITELGTETVIQPTPVKLAASDFESIVTAKVAERKYVSFEGTLTISGNYFNIAIEGTEKAIGSIVKPKENLTELSGKKVVVTGYLMYVNSKYVYAVATSVEDASSAGINTISADKAKNGARYNLAGQKVNAGYKGVVIMNGQKVMQ